MEPIIQSEVSQKDKDQYSILTHIYMEFRKMVMITLYAKQKKMYTDVQNRILDSVGEGEGGMFRENSIETCILSRMKQITSPGLVHWEDPEESAGEGGGREDRDGEYR